MKLTYSQATIGFCPDLTDPSAPPIPLAALVLARSEAGCIAGVGYRLCLDLDLDPIAGAVLEDVPAVLKEHMEETLDALPLDTSLKDTLHQLHTRLRNSLSVLEVADEREIEASDEPAEASSRLLMEAMRNVGLTQRAITQRARQRRAASSRPRRRDVIDVWECERGGGQRNEGATCK